MALIQCSECGKEISDKAGACPNCGNPVVRKNPVPKQQIPLDYRNSFEIKESSYYTPTERDSRPKTWRIVLGVISCVAFFIMIFQSCAAGAVNAILDNGSSSGTAGFFTAILMLTGGIIGMCTNNSKQGTIWAGVCYGIGAVIGILNIGIYLDLILWSLMCVGFSITYIIYGIKWESHSE